jgi:murein DD-endopeptidase MepM/ murein hydrolase activator NlpD
VRWPRRKLSSREVAVLGGVAGALVMVCLIAPIAIRHGGGESPGTAASSASATETTLASAPSIPAPPNNVPSPPPVAPTPPPATPTWRVATLSSDPAIQIVEGTIGRRPMLTVLQGAGLSRTEAYRILNAFSGAEKPRFDRLAPKDSFVVAKDRASGRVTAFELIKSPTEVWQARENDGKLEGERIELHVEHVHVAVGVLVDGELRDSVVKAGLDDDVLELLDDALEGHAELSDVRRGARLRIIATEERIEGAFGRYASLDAVEYTPARSGAAPLRIYWFSRGDGAGQGKGRGGFYDTKGQQPYQGGWRKPIPLARISSRFNPKRKHPVLHVTMPHNGVDFAAPTGTPVFATASGTVKVAGNGGACGNMVQIQHPNGLVSGYCHLSRFAAGLRAGQHVEMRQVVGYVGQTGRVTGPHLHFLIKRGDQFIDPLSLKLDGVRVIPSSDREAFAQRKLELDAALEKVTLPTAVSPGTEPEAPPEETVYEEPP